MMCVRPRSMVSYVVIPLSVVLLLLGIFGIVWLRSNLVSLEYTISELEKKRLDTLRETKRLMAEKSTLLSLKKVEKTAVVSLGLTFPDRAKVVSVRERVAGPYKASYRPGQAGSESGSGPANRGIQIGDGGSL